MEKQETCDIIDCNLIKRLLQEGESEHADFKQEYYSKEKKIDFLHDILCMVNANSPNDRYIIFGTNDDKQAIGLLDTNIKQSDIIDWLRSVNLNKNLYNHVFLHKIFYEAKNIITLQIQNIPLKPFFLTKDYKCNRDKLRAGVVYTRNGDSNTPKNSTASDEEISLMYRERFGVNKAPYEKAFEFLKDYNNWEYEEATDSFYYNKHPKYKIKNKTAVYTEHDNEYILKTFDSYLSKYLTEIDPHKISRETYYVEYEGTEINIKATIISGLDNGRRIIPYPYPDYECDTSKYYIKNNHELDMCQIIQRHYFWNKQSYGSYNINNYDVECTISRFTEFDIK